MSKLDVYEALVTRSINKIKKELGFVPLSIEAGLKRYIKEMETK